jgi:hypothetical protein
MEDKVKVKVKAVQLHAKQAQKGGRGTALPILEQALKGVGGQHGAPAVLTPGKRPGTHCTSCCEYIDKKSWTAERRCASCMGFGRV